MVMSNWWLGGVCCVFPLGQEHMQHPPCPFPNPLLESHTVLLLINSSLKINKLINTDGSFDSRRDTHTHKPSSLCAAVCYRFFLHDGDRFFVRAHNKLNVLLNSLALRRRRW